MTLLYKGFEFGQSEFVPIKKTCLFSEVSEEWFTSENIAFHQLIEATKYALTLTGTFFGGKSTSIFWLLHRLNAGVRKDFAFNDEKRWARLYGVLEMTRIAPPAG